MPAGAPAARSAAAKAAARAAAAGMVDPNRSLSESNRPNPLGDTQKRNPGPAGVLLLLPHEVVACVDVPVGACVLALGDTSGEANGGVGD